MTFPELKKRVKTRRRLKEWELNPFLFSFWQRLFHFEHIEYLFSLAVPLLKITGIYRRGYRNARRIRSHHVFLSFPNLPQAFNGYRILFISDLHADGNREIIRDFSAFISGLEFDLVILGGDYRFKIRGLTDHSLKQLEELVQNLKAKDGILGVLGNHDPWEIIRPLEKMGIRMLINESVKISRDGKNIWILGLDDAHFFESDDFTTAVNGIPASAFRVVVCHSNDALLHIPPDQCEFFLSGHTHGGQICFPVFGPLIVHSRMPRFMAANLWKFNGITGFTTTGVGTSGVPLRFNCPGEFAIIELRAESS
ncbi:MAG: metallophosphoesterase [Calditrichaeota bacterium]|nr:metallophosphoesterase [Calditrichota bacterium]